MVPSWCTDTQGQNQKTKVTKQFFCLQGGIPCEDCEPVQSPRQNPEIRRKSSVIFKLVYIVNVSLLTFGITRAARMKRLNWCSIKL